MIQKDERANVLFFHCEKALHFFPESIMFTSDEIQVMTKHDKNFFHICNDCKPKNLTRIAEHVPINKIDEQINTQHEQMRTLAGKKEKTSNLTEGFWRLYSYCSNFPLVSATVETTFSRIDNGYEKKCLTHIKNL